jgi:hypothetical protein
MDSSRPLPGELSQALRVVKGPPFVKSSHGAAKQWLPPLRQPIRSLHALVPARVAPRWSPGPPLLGRALQLVIPVVL